MKMVLMKITILSCLLWFAADLHAQSAADFDLVARSFAVSPTVRYADRYKDSRNNPNEVQAVLSGLFLAYKNFISSQDRDGRCMYTPSCSVYGLQAVKQLGVVRGGISTFDRLTRCNGVTKREHYEIHPETHLLSDPVSW
jgi:uncharacterized protein